ncbi:hypothetical protein MVEN_00594600 [Mycena venus]|uniref:Uncharacterized protein n=1 Tax=Mycena venus TaxID=2733690 RepID=A0A8H7D5S7_9AGAR|nr:hypothetical protein MVEN_00594600 [Mycena venus]
MSNGSPSAYLLWALLSVSFFTFMLIHLWSYDKFKCLRWDSGRQPGAFKRVMTYSYFATVPLLMVFSVAMAALKYQEGSLVLPNGTSEPIEMPLLLFGSLRNLVMPRPYAFWHKDHLRWIIPLYFVLSIAWSLELVTHLEELTFWLFLLHQGPRKRDWFHCWEFRTWYLGSLMAILGMPLTTLIKRHNVETCLAWIFLGGSAAGTFTTICFLYVLANFPRFIRSVKAEGAEPDVVVRLATFFNLNCIRVVFRFLFTVPLLVLALDGLFDKSFLVVGSLFWSGTLELTVLAAVQLIHVSDIFLMMGAIGCFISSAITLLVFFPRSMTSEAGYRAHALSQNSKANAAAATQLPDYERHDTPLPSPKSMTSLDRSRMHSFTFPQQVPEDAFVEGDALPQHYRPRPPSGSPSDDTMWDSSTRKPTASTSQLSRSDNYRAHMPLFVDGTPIYVEEVSPSPPYPLVHPYAMNFTSPLDLVDDAS